MEEMTGVSQIAVLSY